MAPQAAASQPMYAKNEGTYCFHGELLYEAKILDLRRTDPNDNTSPWEYRVHYKGWKNTWDDWVPQDRVRKMNRDNWQLAKDLRKELTAAQNPPKSSSKPGTKTRRGGQGSEIGSGRGSEERTSSVPRGVKRGARDNDIEKVSGIPSTFPTSREDLLDIPNLLDGTSDLPTATKDSHTGSSTPIPHPPHDGDLLGEMNVSTSASPAPAVPRSDPLDEMPGSLTHAPSSEEFSLSGRDQARRDIPDSDSKEMEIPHASALLSDDEEMETSKGASLLLGLASPRLGFDSTKLDFDSPMKRARQGDLSSPYILQRNVPRRAAQKASERIAAQSSKTPSFMSANPPETSRSVKKASNRDSWNTKVLRSPNDKDTDTESSHSQPANASRSYSMVNNQSTLRRRTRRSSRATAHTRLASEDADDEDEASSADDDTLSSESETASYTCRADEKSSSSAKASSSPSETASSVQPASSSSHKSSLSDRQASPLGEQLIMKTDTGLSIVERVVIKGRSSLKEAKRREAARKKRLQTNKTRIEDGYGEIDEVKLAWNFRKKRDADIAKGPPHRRIILGESNLRQGPNKELYPVPPSTPSCSSDISSTTFSQNPFFLEDLEFRRGETHIGLPFTGMILTKSFNWDDYIEDSHIPKYLPKAPYSERARTLKPTRNNYSGFEQFKWTNLFDRDGFFIVVPSSTMSPPYTLAYNFSLQQEDSYFNRPSVRISVPDHLKNLLVDDWENVTKSCLLVPLPSQAPANFIIDEYFNEEKANRRLDSPEADLLEEFCAGLKTYFERALGRILLYRFERNQLTDYRRLWESGKHKEWDGKGPGDCYGAEHLARMLVNMPEMIAQTNLDVDAVTRLKEELSKFTIWLSRNSARFFCAKYEKPSQEYIDLAR